MSTAVRVNALALSGPGPKTLSSMEGHGKRLDASGRARRVRAVPPLVHGTLDLAAAFGRHAEGCRMNRGLRKPVRHAIVQFPTAIPLPDGPEAAEPVQRRMLEAAVGFINRTYGEPGLPAVFAARLDRDEAGRHAVDVFFAPKFWKETKSRGRELWLTTSRHGKRLCAKHETEIRRRHSGAFSDGPRQVGIALQSEWRECLAGIAPELGLDPAAVAPKAEKTHGGPDRLEPEAFKARRDLKRARRRAAELEAEIGEKEAAASQARHDAEIAAARSSRRRRLDLTAQLAAVSAEQQRLGFHQLVKELRLSRRAAALETELRPLEAASAGTDALAAELTREDRDEKAGNEKQAEFEAGRAALAVQAVFEGLVLPEPEPGQWRRGPRYGQSAGRWLRDFAPVLLPEKPLPWPAAVWRGLRAFAAAAAAPLRNLRAELEAALTARAAAENALAAAVGAPDRQGTHVPRAALDAAENAAETLRGEIAGLKERLAEHEPPPADPAGGPSFGM